VLNQDTEVWLKSCERIGTNEHATSNKDGDNNTLLKVKNMFATFKKLFRKDIDGDLATSIPETSRSVENGASPEMSSPSASFLFPSETGALSDFRTESGNSSEFVLLPVKSILAKLPSSLSPLVQSQGNGSIPVPSNLIMQELPKGAVKLTFGEIRMAAPVGTFIDNPRLDQVLVELPLHEILMRLSPSFLARRPDQKQIQISAEITNIFGPHGEGISLSSTPVTAPKTPKPAPVASMAPVAPESPKITMPVIEKPIAMPAMEKPKVVSAVPAAASIPQLRVLPNQPVIGEKETLVIALSAIFENWPVMVRKEIDDLNLSNAKVALPMIEIQRALASGKVIFTWEQICEWTQPRVQKSSDEDILLELPLQIIAPLFMAKHRPTKVQKKISVADLPDLFAVKTPAAAPVVEPVETAQPIPLKPAAAPILKKESAIGKIFDQPTKQDWSPNEIVKSLAALNGMTGAFVAMQDGLLVAAQLPGTLKAETVAAFLPQIFGRMNQYMKELQLGSLSSITFEVENVSWQVAKAGAVYVAALAKPGQELSREKLNVIAAELGKQI
jgi:predicted regulator of Ras-like GTPase activity (Roadblock/LC7/MglB family)